jgi:hypothetical protein
LRPSLPRQCALPSEPLQLTLLVGGQLVGAELDLDLSQRAGELERRLRVVLVDDRGTSVLTNVEALIERELAERIGLLDATLSHGFSIDDERSLASLAETATVIDEIKGDGMLARRELLTAGDAGLVLPLRRIPIPSWFVSAKANIGLPSRAPTHPPITESFPTIASSFLSISSTAREETSRPSRIKHTRNPLLDWNVCKRSQ